MTPSNLQRYTRTSRSAPFRAKDIRKTAGPLTDGQDRLSEDQAKQRRPPFDNGRLTWRVKDTQQTYADWQDAQIQANTAQA